MLTSAFRPGFTAPVPGRPGPMIVPNPRIMCIGDSITLSVNDEASPFNGYRGQLKALLPNWTPVGITDTDANSSNGSLMWHHGISGSGVDFLNSVLPTSLVDPHVGRIDICLIHEGTNSATGVADGTPDIGARLALACGAIAAANQGCKFIIANPIINGFTGGGQAGQDALNAALVTLNASVAAVIPGIPGATACAMPQALVNNVNIDGVHPRHAGYALMAQAWAATLTQLGYCR